MKKIYKVILTSVLSLFIGFYVVDNSATVNSENSVLDPSASHLIILSLDGLNPEWYLDDKWPAPTLQQLAREGTHAHRVKGVFPSLTFPSHTTIVTGALPGEHGVLSNSVFTPGGDDAWYWYADQLKVKALWDVVKENGGTSAGFNWPVSVGGSIDYNIGDIWSTDLSDELDRSHTTAQPEGFADELGRKVLGEIGLKRLRHHENAGPIVSYMIEEIKPTLLLFHISNTDAAQHRHGREHLEVDRSVAFADVLVHRMLVSLEKAGILDRTTFIITGDHGFSDISLRLQPNTWLVKAGLRQEILEEDNWRATFYTAGGAAFLRLKTPNDQEALRQVENILEDLPASTRQFFKVIGRGQLDELGADTESPLALGAMEGISFLAGGSGSDIVAGSGGTHGHLADMIDSMHTGFIAWGAGVRKGGVIPMIRMQDIGPTAADFLGLQLPDASGIVHPGVKIQD
jgi:predicted AlkP superfamily pyrophosphatase or phosphodiesterase